MSRISLVAISSADKMVCAGVLIAATTVLTAYHCIEDVDAQAMKVNVVGAEGSYSVKKVTLHQDKDLGIIQLAGNVETLHKYVARPHHSISTFDDWSTVSVFDLPALAGIVTNPARTWQSERGYDIEVLELVVNNILGDYAGYSGGPVAVRKGNAPSWFLGGIILEQFEDRADPTRFSNSLVGANIRTIGTLCPDIDAQIDGLLGLDTGSSQTKIALENVASGLIRDLQQYYEGGLITFSQQSLIEASILRIVSASQPKEV